MEDPGYQKLMEYALRALSRRAHTVHELKEKLKKRPRYTEEYEKKIIGRLHELNLLNDEAYIQRSIENATEFRFHGPRKVAERLFLKGIPFDHTYAAWRAMNINEEDLARRALKKKEKHFKKFPKEQAYSKRAQFLASRG